MKRLLVVSHPCVVAENQLVYRELEKLGWTVTIVVPERWQNAYAPSGFGPERLPGFEDRLLPLRVMLPGRPQRHVYLARPKSVIRRVRPDAVFVEQEAFSLAALQWCLAAQRAGIPFGVQAAENLERPLPLPARAIRRWIFARSRFVAARSASAAELARKQGAAGDAVLVPHAVPEWAPVERGPRDRFTVGFAGRLVPEKGVRDLAEAMRPRGPPAPLLLAGGGPRAPPRAGPDAPGVEVELVRDLGHARMAEAYAQMDVLVLPSRTTPRWAEQFGRVLVEALACGVPVVGSDSGEIPWVIGETGGGLVFPEGDAGALATALRELMDDEPCRFALADAGRAVVAERFSLAASARALDGCLEAAVAARSRPTVTLVAHGIHDGGGMERAFAELIRRASDRFDFVVVSAELDEDLRRLVRWRRVRVPMRPISLKTPLFFLRAGLTVARCRSGIVHTLGAIVPNRADLATVQFCHAGHRTRTGAYGPRSAPRLRRLNTALARGFALLAERWCYRPGRARLLAAVSRGVASELERHYEGIPVVLTPNGVELERFQEDAQGRSELRDAQAVTPDDIVLLFVGGDWDHKGLAIAIEALALARDGSGRRLRLWVVGRGDAERFGAIAEAHGVHDDVTFFGPQPSPERFFQAADVFVIASLYETFSIVAHEAAAAGLPVVATRVSGIDELLGAGDAGIPVERNPASVAGALVRLAGDEAARAEMGAAARRRVEAKTWEASAAAVAAAYERLASARPGAPVALRSEVEAP